MVLRTSVDLVHALAVVAASKEHLVCTWRFADEGDFREVGTRATVGTASHTHDDGVVPQAVFLADLLNLVDEDGQVLFSLVSIEKRLGVR